MDELQQRLAVRRNGGRGFGLLGQDRHHQLAQLGRVGVFQREDANFRHAGDLLAVELLDDLANASQVGPPARNDQGIDSLVNADGDVAVLAALRTVQLAERLGDTRGVRLGERKHSHGLREGVRRPFGVEGFDQRTDRDEILGGGADDQRIGASVGENGDFGRVFIARRPLIEQLLQRALQHGGGGFLERNNRERACGGRGVRVELFDHRGNGGEALPRARDQNRIGARVGKNHDRQGLAHRAGGLFGAELLLEKRLQRRA